MRWITLCFCASLLGCTATCLRDSDCMGRSICTDNRCILIVHGDAGRWTPSSVTDEPTDELPASDAGAP